MIERRGMRITRWRTVLELPNEVVDETVAEVLAAQASITSGHLDLEDTLLDGEEGHRKFLRRDRRCGRCMLALDPLVEVVGDGGSSGLVNDTEGVHSGDGAGCWESLK